MYKDDDKEVGIIGKFNYLMISGIVVSCFITIIFTSVFGDYTDNDFVKEKYLHRAEDEVSTIITNWQKENWNSRGFTDEKQFIKTDPEFNLNLVNLNDEYSGAEYVGNATFKVGIGTDTILKSLKGKSVIVHEGFIVKIKTNYTHNLVYRSIFGDEWQLISVQPYYMDPNIEELNDIIENWK